MKFKNELSNMKSNFIIIATCCVVLLSSCTDVVTIASPDDKVCLTFETNSLEQIDERTVRIYYGDPSNKQYATVRHSTIAGVAVYWKTSPLIIRSVASVVENKMDTSLVDISTYLNDTVNDLKYKYFLSYDCREVFQGKYKPCK